MRKIQKFSAALVVAVVMTSGMAIFSTPVYASTETSYASQICTLLGDAATAVNRLPAGYVKTFLLNQIHAAEAKYGC